MTTQARWSTSQDGVRCIVRANPACELAADSATPHELLNAALAASAALRLAKFVRRAKLAVHEVEVEVTHSLGDAGLLLVLAIRVQGSLSGDHRRKLLQVADRFALHRALAGKVSVIQFDSLQRT